MPLSNSSIRKINSPLLKDVMAIERKAFAHPWSAAMMRDTLDAAHTECYGLFHRNGELLGYIMLSVILDEIDVLSMAIHPDYQGQGCGYSLLGHVLKRAKRKQVTKIFLEARRANDKALKLYEKAGFEVTGVRKDYYPGKDKEAREDAILLTFDVQAQDAALHAK